MSSYIFKKPARPVRRVFIHCSASDNPDHDSAAVMDAWHKQNGWAGIVVYGAVRDIAELRETPLGIRALALMPLPTEKRGEGQSDVTVLISGVWVRPGEWLYADADGIVIGAKQL